MVEDVEKLRTELDVGTFLDREALCQNQIKLLEVRSLERISPQVPIGPRLRNCKRGRIEAIAIAAEIPIDSTDEIRPARLAGRRPARPVHDSGTSNGERLRRAHRWP